MLLVCLNTKEDTGISASQKTFIPVEVGSEFTRVFCPSLSVALRHPLTHTHSFFFPFFSYYLESISKKSILRNSKSVQNHQLHGETAFLGSIFGVKLEGFFQIQSSGNKK